MNPTNHPVAASVLLGEAVDQNVNRRPGVPMEQSPPHPMGAAHWTEPERQPDPGNVLKRSDLRELTPVFGTAVPPRGLSGVLRRFAYEIPEHYTPHWLTLMLADRVDAIEHRPARLAWLALPLLAGGASLIALRMKHGRQSWLRRVVG